MEKDLPLTKIALEELKEEISSQKENKKEVSGKIDSIINKIKEAL